MLRMMLKDIALRETAWGMSSRGTISPIEACQEGLCSAVPQPIMKVNARSSHGVMPPEKARKASPAETTIISVCATSMIRRRSRLSASAPAAKENSMTGRVLAAWTNATRSFESEIWVIIQPAPTVWMSPPRLETSVAPQSARKLPLRRGAVIDNLVLKPNPSSIRQTYKHTLLHTPVYAFVTGKGGHLRTVVPDACQGTKTETALA